MALRFALRAECEAAALALRSKCEAEKCEVRGPRGSHCVANKVGLRKKKGRTT